MRHECGDLSDDLATVRAGGPQDFLWIGLKDPTDAEFDEVDDELGLHPLAVEDAVSGRQRVKIERYGSTIFAAIKTLAYVEQTSDIETGEIMIFVGDHFVVTVRRGDVAPLASVRRVLEADPGQLAAEGADGVLHAVLDTVVDTYLDIDLEVANDLDEIEEAVFGSNDTAHSGSIYRLKREVLEFRRAAQPLRLPLSHLAGGGGPVDSKELRLHFRDVSDHLGQVLQDIESYDALLSDILAAHLSQIGLRQNADMRRISAWAAMIAVPTMIAGVYGMNFEHMPELHWLLGYPLALLAMVLAVVILHRAFRRSGWL